MHKAQTRRTAPSANQKNTVGVCEGERAELTASYVDDKVLFRRESSKRKSCKEYSLREHILLITVTVIINCVYKLHYIYDGVCARVAYRQTFYALKQMSLAYCGCSPRPSSQTPVCSAG